MFQNRAMAVEAMVFYEMPLWERAGIAVLGLAAIAVGVAIWRANRAGGLDDPPGAPPTQTSLALKSGIIGLLGVRGFAALVGAFGALLVVIGLLGSKIALHDKTLRCGIPGREIDLSDVKVAWEAERVEHGRRELFQRTRTELVLDRPNGAREVCKIYDHLDPSQRNRLLAAVRARLGT